MPTWTTLPNFLLHRLCWNVWAMAMHPHDAKPQKDRVQRALFRQKRMDRRIKFICPFGLAEQQGFEPWHPFRGLRDFESFLSRSTQWKIEAPTPLYWKAQTIGITSKIHSAPKKHRSHADLNPLQKKRKNPPFGENLKRFCACWRERARELPISSVHPQSMLLLLLTKAKQQRMDEHDNPVRVL